MLGLRRIHGLQVDVWVGDQNDFVSDIFTQDVHNVSALLIKDRHIACTHGCRWTEVSDLLKELSHNNSLKGKRLTFVCEDLETYQETKKLIYMAT